MNIVIPLGGIGKRFLEFSSIPKPFISIFEKEMLRYVLDSLYTIDEDKIFIIYNENTYPCYSSRINSIIQEYTDKVIIPIKIHKQTEGSAETILLGINEIKNYRISENIVCVDCDTFYTIDILNMCRFTEKNSIFYVKNEDSSPIYSYIELDNDRRITDIQEKVKISNYANTGIYFFTNINLLEKYLEIMVDNNMRFKDEYYISCVIKLMLLDDIDFYGIELENKNIFNLGTPQQLTHYMNNTLLFLFDLDGTIVYTDDIYYKVWKVILGNYGIQITKELFEKNIFGNTDENVLKKLSLQNESLENISILKDTLFELYLDEVRVVDGVINFFQKIKEDGHKIAIVTNCNRRNVHKILLNVGLLNHVDHIVIGNECKRSKPFPDPYLKAIDYFNFTPKKSIIFEDSKVGISSAIQTSPRRLIGIQSTYTHEEFREMGLSESIPNYIDMNVEYFKKTIIIENNIKKIVNSENIYIEPKLLCGGYISEIIEIIVDDNKYLVLKQENSSQSFLSEMANNLQLYKKEYYFYEVIYKHIPLSCPKFYGLVYDNNKNVSGILMENLFKKNCIPNLDLNKEDIQISLNIINELIKMHSKFWNNCSFSLQKSIDSKWTLFVKSKWNKFQSKWKSYLTKIQMKKAQFIIDNFQKIEEYFTYSPNLTLCHGDVKSGNIFFTENKEPIFIDWQYIHLGKGVQDIVFFLIESFNIETMKRNKNIFKEYYYDKLTDTLKTPYSREEYEKDFEYSSYYFPFFVAMWFGTMDENELVDKTFPSRFIKRLFEFYFL